MNLSDPQVENVVAIPKEIFKTKPILNFCKNLRKDSNQETTIWSIFLKILGKMKSVLNDLIY